MWHVRLSEEAAPDMISHLAQRVDGANELEQTEDAEGAQDGERDRDGGRVI